MGKTKQAANFTVEITTLEYDLNFFKQLTGTTTVILVSCTIKAWCLAPALSVATLDHG